MKKYSKNFHFVLYLKQGINILTVTFKTHHTYLTKQKTYTQTHTETYRKNIVDCSILDGN